MRVTDFNYDLPEELIAQHPCDKRDESRLMVMDKISGELTHTHFYNLGEYLKPGDTLVFNDTRVIPARLIGTKKITGAKIELLLLKRREEDIWEALVKPGKKVRPGTMVEFGTALSCEILDTTDFGGRIVRFHYQGIFEEVLDKLGETPLPPYIKERLDDKERYQTVYARERGSAAAPTAGLHFTKELMDQLKEHGIHLAFITLHVGLGTFRPVSVENITDHVMHSEFYSVSEETADLINMAKSEGRRIIAVGTTVVRTLESVGKQGKISAGSGWTNIFIYPGFDYKIINGMITNFHLPQSTLLMLVSAFIGREKMIYAYEQAVQNRYRFFSFGDAMLIV